MHTRSARCPASSSRVLRNENHARAHGEPAQQLLASTHGKASAGVKCARVRMLASLLTVLLTCAVTIHLQPERPAAYRPPCHSCLDCCAASACLAVPPASAHHNIDTAKLKQYSARITVAVLRAVRPHPSGRGRRRRGRNIDLGKIVRKYEIWRSYAWIQRSLT